MAGLGGATPTCRYPSGGSGAYVLWAQTINGKEYCATLTPPKAQMGKYEDFAVEDPNDNGVWEFWAAGSEVQVISNPDFKYGEQDTNSERHSDSDDGYADFQGLEFENSSG